jgi:hypothetical protein
MTTYTIFGAGPSGLYTAWRLASSGDLGKNDSIELVEWGDYAFEKNTGTRLPAGRICSYHYEGNVDNSYIEVGGMRFLEYNETTHEGHQLVTKTVKMLGMVDEVVPFLTTDNPLFFLRGVTYYQNLQTEGWVKAPYNTVYNTVSATQVYSDVSDMLTKGSAVETRAEQSAFYAAGALSPASTAHVYEAGNPVSNIGYWNYFYASMQNEAVNYALDAGGYSSNLINWNAANASVYNGEFAPGGAFKTLRVGYSQLFVELYQHAKRAAKKHGIKFTLRQRTRLHSIWTEGDKVHYRTASADDPFKAKGRVARADHAFMAMPRHCIDLVAQATRFGDRDKKHDFLNETGVQNYLQSVIQQPSYKVAMFFNIPWWQASKYPPKLVSSAGNTNIFGPTLTDIPLRQIYYFGDNAPNSKGPAVYGLLASYDDERFVRFWQEMELPTTERREVPVDMDYQALEGARKAPDAMVRMLKYELARVHYGNHEAADQIPDPLETAFMDWGLNPFGAGYHAWAAHYNIVDVMQKIRRPSHLAGGKGNVYIVGSAYSNDQAWVEGAFATAESVLTEYIGLKGIADTNGYPLICGGPGCGG